jgi:short subunit dehydrogenase-like uncharacterized protein
VAGRIVLFGATGYTGQLVAESLVRSGVRPVLAARSEEKLVPMATELGRGEGPLEVRTADVSRAETVKRLVEEGDVLVSTVGPFERWGDAAAEAAVTAGAHYLDSTGEPAFIRRVFEKFGPRARDAGCGMLTAFGYDYVPGNLAGALALRQAGEDARRVDVGYFFLGGGSASGGTQASGVGFVLEPSHAWRGGRLTREATARRVRSFPVRGRERQAVSVGGTEHYALPRIHPELDEVGVYLGWVGKYSRAFQGVGLTTSAVTMLPGMRPGLKALAKRTVKGSSGGPGPEERAKSRSYVVALAYDGQGEQLAEVVVDGQDGYGFTGDILAWGARRVAEGGLQGTGALGPVDGFGLDELAAGCREAGLDVSSGPVAAAS